MSVDCCFHLFYLAAMKGFRKGGKVSGCEGGLCEWRDYDHVRRGAVNRTAAAAAAQRKGKLMVETCSLFTTAEC